MIYLKALVMILHRVTFEVSEHICDIKFNQNFNKVYEIYRKS
jgi:hypothetical protein